MKTIRRIFADFALVLISGSIFPRNRDYSDDWSNSEKRPQKKENKEIVEEHLEFHPPVISQNAR